MGAPVLDVESIGQIYGLNDWTFDPGYDGVGPVVIGPLDERHIYYLALFPVCWEPFIIKPPVNAKGGN